MVTENYNVKVNVQGARQLRSLNASTIAITSSLGGLGTAAKLATGAIAAIGGAAVARSFLGVARQLETLETRLGFLFGTAQEGSRAFEELRDFAGQVPFSLQEIAQAAGVLAVVSKDAEELRTNLELTGNVAAVAGLDFVTAGEQIQRSLSAGISSAELLRERGVREILGFKAGVTVTAEETAEALERVFGPDGKFGNAALALASTFDGLVSMVGDKMFTFQSLVMDAGPFDLLKAIVQSLDDSLSENFGSIENAAEAIGDGITTSVKNAILGGAILLDELQPVFDFISGSINNILRATDSLPTALKFAGVIGFLMLGFKAKLATVFIAGIFDKVLAAIAITVETIEGATRKFAGFLDRIGADKLAKKFEGAADGIGGFADKVRDSMQNLNEETAKNEELNISLIESLKANRDNLGENAKAALAYIERLEEIIATMKKTKEEADEVNKALGEQGTQFKKTEVTVDNFKKTFEETFNQAFDKFKPMQEGVNLLISSFDTFKRGVGDAFADAILGAKSFAESIQSVARAIVRQLISGIIQIGLQVFVFDVLKEKLEAVKKEQQNLNAALGVELGLRTALAFFTGGGSLFAGFFAEGGKIPAGKFGVVGEEGPELIGGPASVTPMTSPQMQTTSQGDVNINFNINTIDARGFDELLVSRRATISGIINQGLNRQGRTALA